MSGQDTDPFATMFAVYFSTMETVYDPVFKRIDLQVDVEGRTGRLVVDGLIGMHGEPIRNLVTGKPARASICRKASSTRSPRSAAARAARRARSKSACRTRTASSRTYIRITMAWYGGSESDSRERRRTA